jgi:EAL domain-containing protein (putative c-di-GMP-specific phosphodiesterase class I)/AmiR/NasT family two-component response regulator
MVLSKLNFLAVEDHEFQLSMLLRMLTGLGATRISAAADGAAALEIIKSPNAAIDIVISDLDMPGMDGLEFMRRLSEARSPVAIILASAMESVLLDSVETMTRAYGVKILGVIQKPITREKLSELIELYGLAHREENRVDAGGPSFTVEEILDGMRMDQFEPFFQPKVELKTGQVKGAEALARWRHPAKGVIVPYAFIETLERSDKIDELTWMMLSKSAAFCREWREASGMQVNVSVNLSLISLARVDLAERVTEIVRGENLDPRHLTMEVTESATATDVGRVLENLTRLRMKGFGLSIDDYGTGYSSMQQLTRIAFTEIKIDQSFVSHAASQHAARVILESSLDMARKLNIISVAEGVETQRDWDLLCQLGCDLAQGYFIAKPMAAAEFQIWARDRRGAT